MTTQEFKAKMKACCEEQKKLEDEIEKDFHNLKQSLDGDPVRQIAVIELKMKFYSLCINQTEQKKLYCNSFLQFAK